MINPLKNELNKVKRKVMEAATKSPNSVSLCLLINMLVVSFAAFQRKQSTRKELLNHNLLNYWIIQVNISSEELQAV